MFHNFLKKSSSSLTFIFLIVNTLAILFAPVIQYEEEILSSLSGIEFSECYYTYEGYVDYVDYCGYSFPEGHRFSSVHVQIIYGVVKSVQLSVNKLTLGEIEHYYGERIKFSTRKSICTIQYKHQKYRVTVIMNYGNCSYFDSPVRIYFYQEISR